MATPAIDFSQYEQQAPKGQIDFSKYEKSAPHTLPAPNPMGMANKELEKSGIQVGVPKLTVPEPKFTGGTIARAATAAGATLGPKPYDPNRSTISQQLENMESQNPTNAKQTIAGIAERAGSGDVPGALGEAGSIAGQIELGRRVLGGGGSPGLEMRTPMTAKPIIPYEKAGNAIGGVGRAIERNAPTIGKVAGIGTGTALAAEELYHGRPVGAGLAFAGGASSRAARIAEAGARGLGNVMARAGHPEAPYAPATGPERVEGEYVAPAANPPQLGGKIQPPTIPADTVYQHQLPAESAVKSDTITADAGEVARRHMIGVKPTEPVILPRENRGLMLPDRGAAVAPQSPSLPPRQAVAAIANEAVKGAGGKPEVPAALERGKPIYQRPQPPRPIEQPLTAVESSALNGFHYDPATQTMTVGMKTGSQYRYAEVTPEEFQKFSEAKSKGKAYQDIKNNHVQTAVNYGKGWNATKPAKELHSSETVPDLVPSLEESIRIARAKKAGK